MVAGRWKHVDFSRSFAAALSRWYRRFNFTLAFQRARLKAAAPSGNEMLRGRLLTSAIIHVAPRQLLPAAILCGCRRRNGGPYAAQRIISSALCCSALLTASTRASFELALIALRNGFLPRKYWRAACRRRGRRQRVSCFCLKSAAAQVRRASEGFMSWDQGAAHRRGRTDSNVELNSESFFLARAFNKHRVQFLLL